MADLASVAGMAGQRGGHIVGVGAVGARAVLGIGMAVAGKVCNPGLSIKMGFSPRRFCVRCYRIDSEFVARHLRACPGAQGHQHARAGHEHGHGHAHEHHHDLNLRSAYLHVVADAATSVLAIAALVGGRYFGATWLDPVMGLAGTILVGRWAWGLLRDTGRVLLDAEMDAPVVEEVREVIRELPQPTILHDLHVWRVGKGKYACILSIETAATLDAEAVRKALAIHDELVHVTVELLPPPPQTTG